MRTRTVVGLLLLPALIGMSSFARSRQQESKFEKEPGERAWLGVMLQDMTPRLAKEMHLTTESGALVRSVVDDSPADKAGIKEDDIIVAFGGKNVDNSHDLVRAVRDAKPETTVDLVVVRGNERKTLKATMGEDQHSGERFSFAPHAMPTPPPMQRFQMFGAGAVYGLRVSTLGRQLGEYFEAPNNHGVLVEEVRKNSPAEKAGFKAGDVITKIGSETIENVNDIYAALDDYKKGDKAPFEILRKGERKSLAIEIDPHQGESRSEMKYFRMFGDDGDEEDRYLGTPWNHQNQWIFQDRDIKENMEMLRERLQDLGRNLKEDLGGLRTRLRRELQSIESV